MSGDSAEMMLFIAASLFDRLDIPLMGLRVE